MNTSNITTYKSNASQRVSTMSTTSSQHRSSSQIKILSNRQIPSILQSSSQVSGYYGSIRSSAIPSTYVHYLILFFNAKYIIKKLQVSFYSWAFVYVSIQHQKQKRVYRMEFYSHPYEKFEAKAFSTYLYDLIHCFNVIRSFTCLWFVNWSTSFGTISY